MKRVLVLLVILLSLHERLSADTSWLMRVDDCKQFREELNTYYRSLGELDEHDKDELSTVLYEACDGKFAKCNFSACKNRKPNISWLDESLSCEEFLKQAKTHYSRFGPYAKLPPKLKEEVAYILAVSCSERFRECHFPNCQAEEESSDSSSSAASSSESSSAASSSAASSSEASSVDMRIWEERLIAHRREEASKQYRRALAEYEALYHHKQAEQRDRIEQKMIEEQERELAWSRFTMPDLIREPKPPKKKEPPKSLFQPFPGGLPSTLPGVPLPTANPSVAAPSFPPAASPGGRR